MVARRPCEAVRPRRRRDQDRLRRAGAGGLHSSCAGRPRHAAQYLPVALPALRVRSDGARPWPGLRLLARRMGGQPALSDPLGRRSAGRLGGAGREPARRAVVRAHGRCLLCYRRRRLPRPAGSRALRPLGPGRGVRLAPPLPRHERARALGLRRRGRDHRAPLARPALPADPVSRALSGGGWAHRHAGDAGDAAGVPRPSPKPG